ncbi:MAG: hypothetical protein C0401_05915 [Anaerolinea sp.]|nr:hypothetical protein [Anaerolinea sp.]
MIFKSTEKIAEKGGIKMKKRQIKVPDIFSIQKGNGFIFPIVNMILDFVLFLNLIEIFKGIARRIGRNTGDKKLELSYVRFTVDLFIILKWIIIAIFWIFHWKCTIITIFVWYLLVTNLFTYFYHHAWIDTLFKDYYGDIPRLKRRLSSLLQAISFSVFGFAFLYGNPYSSQFSWSNENVSFWNSIFYSVSNSLTVDYEPVKALTQIGSQISIIQLAMMFVFFSIILGTSIPQLNSAKDDKNDISK